MTVVLWTPELEESLLSAVCKYRPLGVHRYFRILNIQRFIAMHAGKHLPTTVLWEKLNSFYDLEALNALVCPLFLYLF